MTEHINAREGLKKMHTAVVLILISAIVGMVGGVITLIPVVGTIIGGIIVFAAGVLGIVGAIIEIVGLSNCAKDDEGYKTAFIIVIVSIIVQVVIGIVSVVVSGNTISQVGEIIAAVLELIVFYMVIKTTSDLLTQNGQNEVAQKGMGTWKLVLGTLIAAIIISVVEAIVIVATGGSLTVVAVSLIVAGVAEIVIAVLKIVAYVKYMGFLKASSPLV